jgi:hypothetical protein
VRVTAYTQEKLTVELDKKRGSSASPSPAPVATKPVPAPPAPAPAAKPEEPRRPRARPSTEVLDPWN